MYASRWSVLTITHKYLEKNWCGFKKYEHLHKYCHYILIVGGTFFSLPITALTVVVHPLYLLKHDVIYSNVLLHNIYTLLHCVCSYFVASFYVKSIHRNDYKKWTYSALHLEVDYLQKQWFSHAFTYLLQDIFLAYCYFLNLKWSCKKRLVISFRIWPSKIVMVIDLTFHPLFSSII